MPLEFIENPQLAELSNAEFRQLADMLKRLSIRAPAAIAIYEARNTGTVINAAGALKTVSDGANADGRTMVTGGDVFEFVNALQRFMAFYDAETQAVVDKWNVNGHKG
jgi:multidrug efflux pump subunit AcrA (membrane-fusion protein)